MKLFQIEEPDGSPSDPDAPGAAIGIDARGGPAVVAVAVGGNAAVLEDRDGFALDLAAPSAMAPRAAWQDLFEGVRLRAERALGRPVTHAVVAVGPTPPPSLAGRLHEAAAAAGIMLLRIADGGQDAAGAAILAEDLAPRPEPG